MAYYDRYKALQLEKEVGFFPDIKLNEKGSDKFDVYVVGRSRLDKMSQTFYGEPWWGWLILLANPEQQGLEWLIPNETTLRIPFPLEQTIKEVKEKLEIKKKHYGS